MAYEILAFFIICLHIRSEAKNKPKSVHRAIIIEDREKWFFQDFSAYPLAIQRRYSQTCRLPLKAAAKSSSAMVLFTPLNIFLSLSWAYVRPANLFFTLEKLKESTYTKSANKRPLTATWGTRRRINLAQRRGRRPEIQGTAAAASTRPRSLLMSYGRFY